MSASDLLFASLKIEKPDRPTMRREIESVEAEHWVWDPFRSTSMLPVMTFDGAVDLKAINTLEGVKSKNDGFVWTACAPASVRSYLENHVFPWMGMRSRVMILRTLPGARNNEHIDCEPELMGTRQHKFRMVIHGRTDTLYFITKAGSVHVPETDRPFLIDGSWPHGMENAFSEPKLTLCIGAPWTGCETYPELGDVILRSAHQKPEDLSGYFNSREKPR